MTKEEYWRKYKSNILCKDYKDDFDIWWDPEKFDWKYSWALCLFLSDKFDIWWDAEKYNWANDSYDLCYYLPHRFDTWWNVENYNLAKAGSYLNKYLLHKIVKWYNPEKITDDFCIGCDSDILDSIESIINNLEWDYE